MLSRPAASRCAPGSVRSTAAGPQRRPLAPASPGISPELLAQQLGEGGLVGWWLVGSGLVGFGLVFLWLVGVKAVFGSNEGCSLHLRGFQEIRRLRAQKHGAYRDSFARDRTRASAQKMRSKAGDESPAPLPSSLRSTELARRDRASASVQGTRSTAGGRTPRRPPQDRAVVWLFLAAVNPLGPQKGPSGRLRYPRGGQEGGLGGVLGGVLVGRVGRQFCLGAGGNFVLADPPRPPLTFFSSQKMFRVGGVPAVFWARFWNAHLRQIPRRTGSCFLLANALGFFGWGGRPSFCPSPCQEIPRRSGYQKAPLSLSGRPPPFLAPLAPLFTPPSAPLAARSCPRRTPTKLTPQK